MRKYFLIGLIATLFTSCEQNMDLSQGRIEITGYLNEMYQNKFVLDSVAKDFSQDLFKQQVGFKVWLKSSDDIHFGPIYLQKNEHLKRWITYGGSDIMKEYEASK